MAKKGGSKANWGAILVAFLLVAGVISFYSENQDLAPMPAQFLMSIFGL